MFSNKLLFAPSRFNTITSSMNNNNNPQQPDPPKKRVVVCGGGIIGVCTAYFLSKKGAAVTLVEQSSIACAASGKAGGFLAFDWCDGGPVSSLARASFNLHRSLAQELDGVESYGYRPVNTLSLSVTESGKPNRKSTVPGWIDGPVKSPRTIEMSLLGFVKRKGKGCKATSRPLAPNEDYVLDRTAAVTYNIPATEHDDEPRRPKGQTVENQGNLDRFLFSSDRQEEDDVDGGSHEKSPDAMDHDTVNVTPSPAHSEKSKEDSADKVVLGVEATGLSPSPARKEHHRKRKASEGVVDETPQSGKKHRSASDDEGSKGSEYSYDITETYVPRWQVKNGDTLVDPAVCYQILHHAIPPGELDRARDKKEAHPAEGASVSIVRALSSVSELVQGYFKKTAVEKRLRGRIEEYRAEITKLDAKLAKRKKGERSSVKKGKQAIRALEEMKERHAKETESFQKEIEELKEKNRLLDEQNVALTKASSSLQERIDKAAEEKEAWRQCKVNYDEALAAGDKVIDQLKVFLEDAEKDRDRLAAEMIPLVVSRLHKSKEFLAPLGEMETLLYNSAFHDGIVAGFEGCSAGLKIDGIEGYDLKANTVYEAGVKSWESTTYPYIEGIKELKSKTSVDIEKLVPSGTTETTAQVHPQLFTRKLMGKATAEYGVEVVIGKVKSVETGGGKVTAVMEGGGVIDGDAVVLALGPWTSKFKLLESVVRVHGLKAHSVVLEPKDVDAISADALFLSYQPAHGGPPMDPEIYPRPTGEVYICGMSSQEEVPDDPEQIEPNPDSIRVLKRVAGTVSSHLGEESRVKAEQACFLPCTDDSVPVIGEISGMVGCYVATGHSCWGILNGPATGAAMAELVMDGSSTIVDLTRFSPARFVRK